MSASPKEEAVLKIEKQLEYQLETVNDHLQAIRELLAQIVGGQ